MSCYPSPTLPANLSEQLMHLIGSGAYGRSVTPGCLRILGGDLVVPTGWKRWGRFMAFRSFCHIWLEGSERDSDQAVRKGQLDPLSQGFWMSPGGAADSNYHPCTIHIRSNQLPILPFLHF